MIVKPFRGLRPRPDLAVARCRATRTTCPTDAEARRMKPDDNEDSFLHVVRPEVDLPTGNGSARRPRLRRRTRELPPE